MSNSFIHKLRLAVKEALTNPKKISSREAAKQMDISAATLCRFQKGDLSMDANTLIKICVWISSKTKSELSIDDFTEGNNPTYIDVKFNESEERDIYNTIETINKAVNTDSFSGIFSIGEKIYHYVKIEGIKINILKEVCRRLELYGKWETKLIGLNSDSLPNNLNGICLFKEKYNENLK